MGEPPSPPSMLRQTVSVRGNEEEQVSPSDRQRWQDFTGLGRRGARCAINVKLARTQAEPHLCHVRAVSELATAQIEGRCVVWARSLGVSRTPTRRTRNVGPEALDLRGHKLACIKVGRRQVCVAGAFADDVISASNKRERVGKERGGRAVSRLSQ
jgi:hypothetical protein